MSELPKSGQNLESELIPKSVTLECFWEAIETGDFKKPTKEEIDRMVNEVFFKYEPLVELSDEQEGNVKKKIAEVLETKYKFGDLESLSTHDFALFKIEDVKPDWEPVFSKILGVHYQPGKIFLFDLTRDYAEFPDYDRMQRILRDNNFGPISKEEKIRILTDPEQFCKIILNGGSIAQYGVNRDLTDYDLEEYDFKEWVKRAKERTGKEKITMLDMGAGVGKALFHAKTLDPSIETFGLAITEELATYPVDHFILCPAERMPKEFEESMDFIVENMAAKYFAYPAVVFRNVLKALSVGGMAHFVHFPVENVKKGFKEDMARLYEEIEELVKQGKIEVYFNGESLEEATLEDDEETLMTKDNFSQYHGRVIIFKNKSIKN